MNVSAYVLSMIFWHECLYFEHVVLRYFEHDVSAF